MDSFLDESESQSIVPVSSTVSSSSSSATTSCATISMKLNDATVIVSVIILCLINVIVIAGNILVIVSVFTTAKLRTVTNFFIEFLPLVSLAVADLLVGIAVLPYSLTLEILDVWVFGEIWCQGWLATDVWMCTASILNLCAISVDRYLAVTRPVRYRSIMTSKRAKLFIAAVWVLSFIICFPPLVGWNDVQPQSQSSQWLSQPSHPLSQSQSQSHSFSSTSSAITTATTSSLKTIFAYNHNHNVNNVNQFHTTTSSPTNLLLNMSSSEVSTLLSTLTIPPDHHINDDNNNTYLFETSNSSNDLDIDSDSDSNSNCESSRIKCALFNNKGYVIYSALGSFYIPMFVMIFFYWRIYLVASRTSRALKRGYYKSNGSREERMTLRMHRGLGDDVQSNYGYTTTSTYLSTQCSDTNFNSLSTTTTASVVKTSPVSPKTRSVILRQTLADNQSDDQKLQSQSTSGSISSNSHQRHNSSGKRQMPITLYRSSRLTANLDPSSAQNGGNRRMSPSNQSNKSTLSLPSSSSPSSSREGSARSTKLVMSRYSKRTSKYQAKRFHAETKAAKTVGIIVGGFIVCWLPFFTVYLARVFCVNAGCIPDLLFSIFIWLGYCNSMINPCIYGLFSKDFRRAFKNIICRCKFSEETVSSLIRQIHMPTFFEDMPEDITKHESQEY